MKHFDRQEETKHGNQRQALVGWWSHSTQKMQQYGSAFAHMLAIIESRSCFNIRLYTLTHIDNTIPHRYTPLALHAPTLHMEHMIQLDLPLIYN